jgi:hypothetical protein
MKKVMKTGNLCLLVFGIMLTASLAVAIPVRADVADVELYIEPAVNAFPSTTQLHTRFNVTVWWKDNGTTLSEVFAWQVALKYNFTLLNCTRGWLPVWDDEYIFRGKASVAPSPAFHVDDVWIMDNIYAGTPPSTGELKKLAIIEMDIIYIPPAGITAASVLDIDNVDTLWSPDGFDYYDTGYARTNAIYTIPELSLIALTLALFTSSTTAVILHKRTKNRYLEHA